MILNSQQKKLRKREQMEEGKGLVCVTGGTGFVASWLIMRLLEHGYTVRTTIRSSPGEKRLYHLLVKLNVVRTDDVARAYIFLLEFPHAKGRYICSWEEISINEMSEFLSARYPEFQTPTKDSLKDIKGFKMRSLSPKKLLDCGFKFEHGLVDMFDGAIQSCKEKGFI